MACPRRPCSDYTLANDWAEIRCSGRFSAFMGRCLGIWVHATDSLLTTTVMPAVTAEIGGLAWVDWALKLYEIVSIVAGVCTGVVACAVELGQATVLATTVFALGCVVSAVVSDMSALLADRLIQRLGSVYAGSVYPCLGFAALRIQALAAALCEHVGAVGHVSLGRAAGR